MRVAPGLLAVVLLAGGCTADGQASAPVTLPFAAAGEIVGRNGSTMRITPRGVVYWKGFDEAKPSAKWFLFVAYRVETTGTVDHIPAATPNGGLFWTKGEQTVTRMQGNVGMLPWRRFLKNVTSVDIPADGHADYVQSLDVPERGGTLVYTGQDGRRLQWPLPEQDSGKGTDEILDFVKHTY
ncbi:hypothetical protein [Streptosporangium saharense]|uniref:hypothetical protein n=1 Tax=Streptosporangium saharense TaxID=1706840 RepID=UPI00341DC103